MRWPAEWEPHDAVWIGFPGNSNEWPVGLSEAQREVIAFANALWDEGRGEQVNLVCRNAVDAIAATKLASESIEVIVEPFGDIWLRDTCPILSTDNDKLIANIFDFNGWGGKFDMAGDQDIGHRLASRQNIPMKAHDWILEGGAIDGDGCGRLIATEECVLNANRNRDMTKEDAESRLQDAFGVTEVCWLGNGLMADHTDGHVDNLARFVGPGKVVIPRSANDDDPNHTVFEDATDKVAAAGLNVVRLPSVEKYTLESNIAPASYMNFYIGNSVVAVPQYGVANDERAVQEISTLFPERKVVGLPSKALLRGGGSFHCISQQIPMP